MASGEVEEIKGNGNAEFFREGMGKGVNRVRDIHFFSGKN